MHIYIYIYDQICMFHKLHTTKWAMAMGLITKLACRIQLILAISQPAKSCYPPL